MENEDGLFELDNNVYTLKLNMNKVEAIEAMLNVSFMAEIQRNGGVLSFRMLKAIFMVGLYDTVDEKAVKGKKATEIYEKLLKDIGLSDLMAVTYHKLQEDLAFLFQGN